HHARVVDVLSRAAGALTVGRGALVVELQGHADDVVALGHEQRGRHRGIDAARHGHHHAGVLRPPFDIETVEHGGCFRPLRPTRPDPARPDGRLASLYYRDSTPRSHDLRRCYRRRGPDAPPLPGVLQHVTGLVRCFHGTRLSLSTL